MVFNNCLPPTVLPCDDLADERRAQDEAREADGGVAVDGFGFTAELDGEPTQVSSRSLRFIGRAAAVIVCGGELGQHFFIERDQIVNGLVAARRGSNAA